jgi:thiamine biosynthesis lipoprotein ApbE
VPGPDDPVGGAAADRETDPQEVTTFAEDVEEADGTAPAGLTLEAEEEGDIAKQVEEFRSNNVGKDPDPLEVS